jgi:hypothetical protein
MGPHYRVEWGGTGARAGPAPSAAKRPRTGAAGFEAAIVLTGLAKPR